MLFRSYEKLPLLSAAAPFKAGGRQGWHYYTDIPAGPIAVRHVADLYIYPNTLKAVRITGAQVREWLEMSAGAFNRIDPQGPKQQALINDAFPTYNFDTLDGVTYQIDVTQPARYDRTGKLVAPESHRIADLRHQGQPIDEKASFIVVTNNYRASGGGNFPGLDGKNIVMAWDVLDGSAKTGQEVVVVGGGLTGSDCAYYLARQGKRVSLINNSQVLVHVERLSKLTLKIGRAHV